MVDHEDATSTRSTSPTPREREAERKHVERMHSHEDSVRRTDQQKREREERYARRTRQRTTEKEEGRNASEPPAIGSHTTEASHHRSQSEGGNNDKTYKGHNPTTEDTLTQSEDEDDLILGTPLGTYILRTKGTKENIGTHLPNDNKGKTPQGNTSEKKNSPIKRIGSHSKGILKNNLVTNTQDFLEEVRKTTRNQK